MNIGGKTVVGSSLCSSRRGDVHVVDGDWENKTDSFALIVVSNVKVDEELVSDVDIRRHVCLLDETLCWSTVEEERNSDATRLIVERMALFAFLHVEHARLVWVQNVVLVDTESVGWEADGCHEQAVELVRREEGYRWWLFRRKGESSSELCIGCGAICRTLDHPDTKLVNCDALCGAPDIETKVKGSRRLLVEVTWDGGPDLDGRQNLLGNDRLLR